MLHDLVTVFKEYKAFCIFTATGKLGRLLCMWNYKSGNLPDIGTGTRVPNHE